MPTIDGEQFDYTEKGKADAEKAKTKKAGAIPSPAELAHRARDMHENAFSRWASGGVPQGSDLPPVSSPPAQSDTGMEDRMDQLLEIVAALLAQDEQGQDIFGGTVYDDPVLQRFGPGEDPARPPGSAPTLRPPSLMHWPEE